MMSTEMADTSANGNAGSGPSSSQATKVTPATETMRGTNHCATRSASPWTGRPGALSGGHEGDDAREHGVAADVGGDHQQRALAVQGAAGDPIARRLRHGRRLTAEHALVHRGGAVPHLAVHGHPLAGPDAQQVAISDVGERRVVLIPVGGHPAGRRRGQVEERPERVAGVASRPELEDLADEHQSHDHHGGLEVNGHVAVGAPEGGREDCREQRREEAVAVSGTHPERDQRPHVEVPGDQGGPGRG